MKLFALLSAILVAALAPSAARAESLPARQVLVTVDCSHTTIAIRPHVISVSCDRTFKLYGIRWRSWGRHGAVGIGHARLQGCSPACANGEVTRPLAKLRLTHVVTVDGIWMFSRLSFTLVGRLPAEYTRHRGILHMLPEH